MMWIKVLIIILGSTERNRILEPYQQNGKIPYENCKNEDDRKFADFLSTLEYDVVCKSTILNIKEMMENKGLL